MTFGTLYNHIQGKETYFGVSPGILISDSARSGGAFYAQREHRLWDGLKLIGGFQAMKIGNIAVNVVPRAGVLWTPAPRVTVKALYGKAFRAPSLNEVGLRHPGLQGTPNLFDAGVSYQEEPPSSRNQLLSQPPNRSHRPGLQHCPGGYLKLGEASFHGVEWKASITSGTAGSL